MNDPYSWVQTYLLTLEGKESSTLPSNLLQSEIRITRTMYVTYVSTMCIV